MKKIQIFLFFLLLSCGQLIDPPKNLVAKDKMSELVAEFAMNDQLNTYVPGTNLENATRVVLKSKGINPEDFVESYKYYTATDDLEKILNSAQDIILEKDPAAKIYIEQKIKEKEEQKKKDEQTKEENEKKLQNQPKVVK